jgi:hypothetical protein
MIEPSKLQAQSRQAFWLNKLLAFAKSLRIRDGVGYKIKRTPDGTILSIDDRGGGSSSRQVWL